MLTAVLCPPSMADLHNALSQLDTTLYQGIELRLDYCRDLDVDVLPDTPLPVIMTLRSRKQGGAFEGSEKERHLLLEKLLNRKPDYLDVEDDVPPEILHKLHRRAQETTLVLSHHDFRQTPDLPKLLAAMKTLLPPQKGVLYKIACQAETTLDALHMLVFCRLNHPELQRSKSGLVGISMGKYGETTRILAPVVHQGFMYCPVSASTAPGQLEARHLVSHYNADILDSNTAIYGLIGDPVEQSQGHILHNTRNRQDGLNAVYVKWHTPLKNLEATLDALAVLGVKGLSVTMPLKKAVLAFCEPAPLAFQEDTPSIAASELSASSAPLSFGDAASPFLALPPEPTAPEVALPATAGSSPFSRKTSPDPDATPRTDAPFCSGVSSCSDNPTCSDSSFCSGTPSRPKVASAHVATTPDISPATDIPPRAHDAINTLRLRPSPLPPPVPAHTPKGNEDKNEATIPRPKLSNPATLSPQPRVSACSRAEPHAKEALTQEQPHCPPHLPHALQHPSGKGDAVRKKTLQWEGVNTDGPGALRSLPFSVREKTAILIGAGGAALALIAALHEAGARCLVYNRSPKKLPYGYQVRDIKELFGPSLPQHDLIINTLPFTLEFPFERLPFVPGTLAFDISYAHDSPFLKTAAQHGCQTLTGQGMFEEQALLQRQFWGLLPAGKTRSNL